MNNKKWMDFMLNDIEKAHERNVKKIKDKGFKVKEEDKAILFVSEIECDHVWEHQEEERDTNLQEITFCIKCDAIDETDYKEENE